MKQHQGLRLFLGRPGFLAAVRRGELAIGVDQASIHQKLTGHSRVAQLLQERIDLLTPQLPRGWGVGRPAWGGERHAMERVQCWTLPGERGWWPRWLTADDRWMPGGGL